MSIRVTRTTLLIVLITLVSGTVLAQEQGQYRSRIMVDPLGELGKGSEMSVGELEQQIDSIVDPYARSSATRHLARHYVQQKDYASAVAWYQEALSAGGLSDVANREMLRELAQVYLLSENYKGAADTLDKVLAIKLVPESSDYLLLAQAEYRLGNYVAVVAALDGIQAQGLKLDAAQMQQALALYYRAGAFEQCEDILQQLLAIQPHEASHWHQLASVYLQQNKRKQARDQLMLAMEKGIPFTRDELVLLIDLQAITGNPYGAALIMQESIKQEKLAGDAADYRKLFELWLQARERGQAVRALNTAARLSGDTELYLYLAQLQMEDQMWPQMESTIILACENQIQDRYVSRANLYLGVSLLKQGRENEARRAFINGTLVGGANVQSGQWLEFMDADPPTKDEVRRVVGPCYGSTGKRGKLAKDKGFSLASTTEAAAVDQAAGEVNEPLEVKTLAAARFYYSTHTESLEQLAPRVKSLAVRLNVALVKAGGSADGPLHILPGSEGKLLLAFPVKGVPQARGRFRMEQFGELKVAWKQFQAAAGELAGQVSEFARQVNESGHEVTGDRRLILLGGSGDSIQIEVQIGVQ